MVGKGELLGVALNEFQVGDGRFQLALARGGDGEHLWAEIEAGDRSAAFGEGERDVAGAAAQVEGAGAGSAPGEGDDPPLPAPVQPEALEVIDQVITAGDAGEKGVHFRGALFAGRIVDIAHGAILTAGAAGGKPEKLLCTCAEALLVCSGRTNNSGQKRFSSSVL